MLTSFKSFLKRTPWGRAYSEHRMRQNFWTWSPRDEAATRFYGQFIAPGDTVFDVGANRGNRAKIFLHLGASVVLVEPQNACTNYLKIVLKKKPNWSLIESALGTTEGEQDMFVSSDDVLSSLSPRWVSAVKESGRFFDAVWSKRQKVSVTTLDTIIKKYGAPSFIKIDVEGYEKEALSGLTTPPKAVSFEFTPEYFEETFACIDYLVSMADFEFQISLGESMLFDLDRWLSAPDIKDYIQKKSAFHNAECFGDIYARKR